MIEHFGSELYLFQRHQLEALFGAHIHAAATQNTSRRIGFIAFENRIDPAAKAAACFALGTFLVEADFNFRHSRTAVDGQHGNGFAVQAHKIREHAMVIENFDFDLRLRPFAPGEEFVDPGRNAPPVAHAVDDQARAEYTIASGEDARSAGHEGVAVGHDQPARRDLYAIFRLQEIQISALANGHDDGIAFDHRLAIFMESRIEPPGRVEDPFGFDGFETHHFSVTADHLLGSSAVMQDDAFDLGFLDFLQGRRHLLPVFEADNSHFARPHAQRRKRDVHHFMARHGRDIALARHLAFSSPGMLLQHFASGRARHVHGDIAAANDDDFFSDVEPVPEIGVEQEIDSFVNAVQIHSRYGKIAAAVGANRDHDRIESLRTQSGNRVIAAGGTVQFQGDVADFEDFADLRIHHAARQAVFRNSQAEHPTRHRRGVEDGHRVTFYGQVGRRREPNRTASHYGDAIRQLGHGLAMHRQRVSGLGTVTFRQEALQGPTGNRLLDGAAPAGGLTRVSAHAPADTGHRVGFTRPAIGLFELPFRNQRDVAPGIGSGRARHHAGKIAVEPVAVYFLVAKAHSHNSVVPVGGRPFFGYFVKLKSTAASPGTFAGLDCTFMPSCHADAVYWPSGTFAIL